jgi:hypothetical protein
MPVTSASAAAGTAATVAASVVGAAVSSLARRASSGWPIARASRVTSSGAERTSAGTARTRTTPLSPSTLVASGTPCRSVIIPRDAGSRTHRVICSCPAAANVGPAVARSCQP